MAETKKNISISIDLETIRRIKDAAKSQRTTVSALTNYILKMALDEGDKLAVALKGMNLERLMEMLTKEGERIKAENRK